MLVVGKSFDNVREAAQGLVRVGRLDDPCRRIAIEGIPLVDPMREALYQTRLLAFCRTMNTDVAKFRPLADFKHSEEKKK